MSGIFNPGDGGGGGGGVILLKGVQVKRDTAQTISHSTNTNIIFESVDYDPQGFWSGASPTRLTVPAGMGGLYMAIGSVTYQPDIVEALCNCILLINGSIRKGISQRTRAGGDATFQTIIQVVAFLELVATDYVELRVRHHLVGDTDIGTDGTWIGAGLSLQPFVPD